jgi:DNA-binding winged helix-turn-helix (wHTH) protein
MSKLSDLAVRPDFDFGSIRVSPSRRLVEGPAGRLNLEPLIMQVFLLLLDARGTVVTRDQLFDACWGGVVVGDDSLNRAVARVRRIAIEVAPGSFEVETIPRTGYRLVGRDLLEQAEDTQASPAPRIARRTLIAGAVALAGAGSVGWWSVRRYEANRPQGGDRGRRGCGASSAQNRPVRALCAACLGRPPAVDTRPRDNRRPVAGDSCEGT